MARFLFGILFTLQVTTWLSSGQVKEEPCGGKPSDVVFILDASNSIWEPDFRRQLFFISEVIRLFTLDKEAMHVGVATFNDVTQLWFDLNTYTEKRDVLDAVAHIYQGYGDTTNTADALRFMREEMLTSRHGSRDNVTKVAIVITDGRSMDAPATKQEAEAARALGIHLFAVGVGDYVDEEELVNIASSPTDHYMFKVDSYSALENIKELLAIKTCTVTEPPTTPPPSTTPMSTTTTTTSPTTTTTSTTTTTTTTARPTPEVRPLRFETPPPIVHEQVHRLRGDVSPFGDGGDNLQEFKGPREQYAPIPAGQGQGGGENETKEKKRHRKREKNRRRKGRGDGKSRGLWEIGPGTMTENNGKLLAELVDDAMNQRGCIPKGPVDIAFVIDTKNGGIEHNREMLKFVKDTVSNIKMLDGNVRLRFIYECSSVEGLNLGDAATTGSKTDLVNEIERRMREPRTTSQLMYEMVLKLSELSEKHKNRTDIKRIGVYITDGETHDLENTLLASQEAKLNNDISLFGVGVGDRISPTELQAIVSCDPYKHLFRARKYAKLQKTAKKLARRLCSTR